MFRAATKNGATNYRYFNEQYNAVTTLSAAALKTTGSQALLRFDNVVTADVYHSLAATYGADNFYVGTIVCKASDLKDDTVLTAEGLMSAGVSYIDVKAQLQYYTKDYAVVSSTVLVDADNYDTDYVAIGYMTVKTDDGVTHTYWSNTSAYRSVSTVAKAALRDLKLAQEGIYVNEVDGKFSPYTAAERTVLESFVK